MPTQDLRAEAEWLASLGEPTRLALVRVLATGEHTVTALAKLCGEEIVNVSHHLKVMRDGGLVTTKKDGRFVIYKLVGAKAVGTALELAHASGVKVVIPLG